jgi:hypothetical protein
MDRAPGRPSTVFWFKPHERCSPPSTKPGTSVRTTSDTQRSHTWRLSAATSPRSGTSPATRTRPPPPSTCTTQKLLHAARSPDEPEFWTPKWTPSPIRHPMELRSCYLTLRNHWVGHPGLEPGANGLRKAIYDSLSPAKRKVTGVSYDKRCHRAPENDT